MDEKPVFEEEKVGAFNQGAVTVNPHINISQALWVVLESGLSEKHCREGRFVHRMNITWVDLCASAWMRRGRSSGDAVLGSWHSCAHQSKWKCSFPSPVVCI